MRKILDFNADFDNAVGDIDVASQYQLAYQMATKLKALTNGKDLTFVGHSLGGGLAAIASMVTGRPAMTYNPAVVMALLTKTLEQFGIKFDDSNIYKYIMEGDPITRWQEEAGFHAWGNSYDVPKSNPKDKAHSIFTLFNNLK